MINQFSWSSIRDFLSSGESIYIEQIDLRISILGLVALIPTIVLISIIFRLLRKYLSSAIKYRRAAPDLYNGISFILKIVQIILIVWLILFILGIPNNYIVILTGLITTAIAFASANSLNNFIAGIWINFSDPFHIGDYVRIGGLEGVIVDIVLTNTKIKHKNGTVTNIPNMMALKSNITNYSLSLSRTASYLKELRKQLKIIQKPKKHNNSKLALLENRLQSEIERNEEMFRYLENAQSDLKKQLEKNVNNHTDATNSKNYTDMDTFVQYVFFLELPKQREKNQKILTELCNKWKERFLISPKFTLVRILAHFIYQFTIITPDPEYLLNYLDEFTTDIYSSIYSK